eukprot:scaffold95383_cov63-Phaeocystis_antarctica.AAC.2
MASLMRGAAPDPPAGPPPRYSPPWPLAYIRRLYPLWLPILTSGDGGESVFSSPPASLYGVPNDLASPRPTLTLTLTLTL